MTQCDLRVNELMFSSSAIIMVVQSFEVQFLGENVTAGNLGNKLSGD